MDGPSDAGDAPGLLEPAALAAMPGIAFLRSVLDGSLPELPFAAASDIAPVSADKLVHKGGQIASAEGKIRDREGRLVADGSETCFLRSLSTQRP